MLFAHESTFAAAALVVCRAQVRRGQLSPQVSELPQGVGLAVNEPLPNLRSTTFAKDVKAGLRVSVVSQTDGEKPTAVLDGDRLSIDCNLRMF